jgi:hypothetical protein
MHPTRIINYFEEFSIEISMDFTPVSQQVYKFIYQYNVLKEASGKQVA